MQFELINTTAPCSDLAFSPHILPDEKKSSATKEINLRPFSGPHRAAARAMLYPVGFKDEDFPKPIIGIASLWSSVTSSSMHIDKLALEAEKSTNENGGKAIVFNTITISDGISMGSEGMKYSLVSLKSSPTPSKPSWAARA